LSQYHPSYKHPFLLFQARKALLPFLHPSLCPHNVRTKAGIRC
jgi:hypothetical protein